MRLSPLCMAFAAVLCAATVGTARAQVRLGPGAIAALVRDDQGKPVAGALVVADGPTERRQTTGLTGLVVLQALPVGRYAVSATRGGYGTAEIVVDIGARRLSPAVLELRLPTGGFAGASTAATSIAVDASPADDPVTAHLFLPAPAARIVGAGGRPVVAIDGTSPHDSRSELDGLPLAGSAARGAATLPLTALALAQVDLAPAGTTWRDSPRNAIGGVVGYRTPEIAEGFDAGAEAAYDSGFGSFQRLHLSTTIGRAGLYAGVVAGGGDERVQVVKARYGLSSATSLGVAAYGIETATSVQPLRVADLTTSLGRASFEARTYDSRDSEPFQRDRVRGTQVALDLPAGPLRFGLALDRRTETAALEAASALRSYATISARAEARLARSVRLELTDAYGGGSQLGRRHDPTAAVTIDGGRLSARASAGSAYATAPVGVLAALGGADGAAANAPETAFAYRVATGWRFDSADRLAVSGYTIRRRNAFAQQAEASSRGVSLGFVRDAPRGGVGGEAFVDIARATTFGAPQPPGRLLPSELLGVGAAELADVAGTKRRLALDYRAQSGVRLRLATTWFDAGPLAAAPHGIGEAAVEVPLGPLAARFGVFNAFGVALTDPVLARAFPPHEVTFALGRR